MEIWQKRVIAIGGLLLALPGIFVALGYFCATVILVIEGDRDAIGVGLASFTLMVLTLGAGGVTFWHAWRSLQGWRSKPLHLPPIWLLAALFGLFVAMALVIAAPTVITNFPASQKLYNGSKDYFKKIRKLTKLPKIFEKYEDWSV